LTSKLGCFSDVHQHYPCIAFMFLQSYVQVEFEHPLTTWFNPQLVDSQLYAHLECQTWGANHDLQRKVFTGLMNALCCYTQTLPWSKVLTNNLDDNWLYIIDIIPKFD